MAGGELTHEMEVNVAAPKAWELYGTLRLSEMVRQELSHILSGVEVVEGDGGVGTIIKLTFQSGMSYKELFTKVDNEKFHKETETVEGGFLDLGFSLYRVTFDIFEKGSDACNIKTTIQYQVKEDSTVDTSIVSIGPLAAVAEAAKKQLTSP
ncbi:hypothetical protein MLD38_029043 [Melastoma candidum]|uniref:Uncharacterized protein n=1 Tax=Melastoma candidum TaxID=119954 RepID=A0ACB9N2S3_9MYRT|nr:hypothetical protein MLD38_029043 [Melastoma candidum]